MGVAMIGCEVIASLHLDAKMAPNSNTACSLVLHQVVCAIATDSVCASPYCCIGGILMMVS